METQAFEDEETEGIAVAQCFAFSRFKSLRVGQTELSAQQS